MFRKIITFITDVAAWLWRIILQKTQRIIRWFKTLPEKTAHKLHRFKVWARIRLKRILAIRPRHVVRATKVLVKRTYRYLRHTPPRQMLSDFVDWLSYLWQRLRHQINKNWKARSLSGLLMLGVIVFGIFHFYWASLGHIYKLAEYNYTQTKSIFANAIKVKRQIELAQPDTKSLNDLLATLHTNNEELKSYRPNRLGNLYVKYDIRNLPGNHQQAELLKDDNPFEGKDNYSKTLSDYYLAVQYLQPVITYANPQTDVYGYISALQVSIDNLGNADLSKDLDIASTQKWLNALLAQAQELSLTGDKARFVSRQSDYNAELLKDLKRVGTTAINQQAPKLSELVSDYESLVFYIKPYLN